ncbi:arrestin domain-containing protein 3-like isoform X2 [Oratosquilla oratoria]|uniref:arrestin domain-containing protein 3-like isoform X2 n=1 Tax=Oratosquilla oratoria TaxID=337810 RepID=UPI003F774C98
MPTSINIILDYPDIVYFPGQTITGRIELSNTSPKNCRGVKVKFKGYSKVRWTEDKGDSTKTYKSNECYYNTKYYVWGDGNETELPPGNHAFNFSFMLPPNIPSSFESKYGKILHEVSAALDLPMALDKECTKLVSVSSLYDLNTLPGVISPVQENKTKHLCCCCCRSGPMSIVLNIEKTGFASGENISINAECTNMSNRSMNKTEAKIIQKVTCYANGEKRSRRMIVASVQHPSIPEGESDIWSSVLLKIPPLPPSELPGCQNISIKYIFEFSMDPGGMAMDLEIEFPIIIGTIPLRSAHQNIMVPPRMIGYPAPPAVPPAGLVAPDPDSQPMDEKRPLHPSYPPAPGGPPGYPSAPGALPGYNSSPSAPCAPGAPPGYPGAPGVPPGYPGAPGVAPGCPGVQGVPPGYSGAPGALPGYPGAPGAPSEYPSGPQAPPSYSPPDAGGAAPSATLYFPGLVYYPDMPPPSYDKYLSGPQEITNDSDNKDTVEASDEFTPRYVTYCFR